MIGKSENPQRGRSPPLLRILSYAESNCESLACNGSEAKAGSGLSITMSLQPPLEPITAGLSPISLMTL